ncbi:MAG: phosphoribosylglycinamide formyltransferase [Candidatus ainarchaeum sp.]|nr:phosphoribosylglycinamide formyltransferase [Candidatus ainarchaeum sp.]MDD5095899.1 phosphoribosylglycinamide formyltransferase [Candidatus ainarchaeum sp.]
MIKIGVLASGRGSNFQSIIDGIRGKEIDGRIVALIVDKPEAGAVERAQANGVPYFIVERKEFAGNGEMNRKIAEILEGKKVDLVVLAGYMRIVGKELLEKFRGRMINIHPALLPSFPGLDAQKQAFEHGVKVSGCTVHFVDEGTDTGPIIEQTPVYIGDCKDAHEVSERILPYEHETMRKVVSNFSKGKYVVEGRRVRYEHGL